MLRRVARNLQWGRLCWKLETTANNFDPDFHQSWIGLKRFFCQIQVISKKKKKKKRERFSLNLSQCFCPNSGGYNIKFKSKSHQVFNEFSSPISMGGLFLVFENKSASKKKTNHIFQVNGVSYNPSAPPPPPPPQLRYWECSRPRSRAKDTNASNLQRKKRSSKIF